MEHKCIIEHKDHVVEARLSIAILLSMSNEFTQCLM